jgi:Tfp pilus assembly protein PilN
MTINLIPPQLKADKKIRKTNHYISLILISFLLILLAVSTIAYFQNYSLKNDLNDVKVKVNEREGSLIKYMDLQKKIDSANSKLALLKDINSNKYDWSVIIKDLAASTPTVVSIKSLAIGSDNKNVTLTGIAETRRDIAKFKEKLEQSKYFKNVVFSSSSLNGEANDYNFSLTAELEYGTK